MRLWVAPPNERPLPDEYIELWGSTKPGHRGGIFIGGTPPDCTPGSRMREDRRGHTASLICFCQATTELSGAWVRVCHFLGGISCTCPWRPINVN